MQYSECTQRVDQHAIAGTYISFTYLLLLYFFGCEKKNPHSRDIAPRPRVREKKKAKQNRKPTLQIRPRSYLIHCHSRAFAVTVIGVHVVIAVLDASPAVASP